jgi:hypothetical protein
MSDRYILDDDNNPIPCKDLMEWGHWIEDNNEKRRVAESILDDGKRVSTVFLGLDHSFGEESAPVLFETMVFPNKESYGDLDCERYRTWDEALAGHEAMVKKYEVPTN